MVRFELSRLATYDDESLLNELRRVARFAEGGTLTRALFNKHAKVHASTIYKRFGGWKLALERAGVDKLYAGRSVSPKMKRQTARGRSADQLIIELQRIARELAHDTLTTEEFEAYSDMSVAVLRRRFGSWNNALREAGLSPRSRGRRYTDDEYFENLLLVWIHYGRQPLFREMNRTPSTIPAGAYEKKWGSWTKALLAFIAQANADVTHSEKTETDEPNVALSHDSRVSSQPANVVAVEDRHKIPLGLRYSVLSRDRFRCTICGSSPATDASCNLHVDHIIPFSKSGKTALYNLRTLCSNCNLGKSDKASTGG